MSTNTGDMTITDESYRKLVQTLKDPVLMTAPSGDLLDINQAGLETLGYPGGPEIRGIPMDRHYVNPNDRRQLMGLLEDRGFVKDFETRFIRKDGREISVWITANARRDRKRRVLYHEKIIKEVTDDSLQKDRLLEKNRLLEKAYREVKQDRDRMEVQAGMLVKAVAEGEEAKRTLEEQNRRIMVELEMAAKLQRSLLPKRYPRRKGIRFASKYIPSNRIGGDFFDTIELANGDVGVVIADVSGHGPAAALLTTMFKMSFQRYAREYSSPSSVLEQLNREFCRFITTGEYITAFYLVFNARTRKMVYSKAGHPYPILYRRNTNTHELLDTDGFFIGMFDEALFENKETPLNDGDRLLLYTDGVIEARNPAGGCFDMKQLKYILTNGNDLSCHSLIEEIYQELSMFTQKDRFDDDLCMVLLSVGA
jgi:PAS domain S-box-containing protein